MVSSLPGPLRLASSYPFVGRERELATLRALLPRAKGEGRRIALVGGEAGSGKSRLTRELAREADADGVLVLYGACDTVAGAPYRAVVESLERLALVVDRDELRADLGAGSGELARLLPDLPALVGELPEPVAADADTQRHRLHTAVTDLLTAAGRRRPLLLVIEDGHWADTPTLLLVRHLARSAADARVLIVATFRDTEADVPAELAETLADLRRAEDVVRLHLGGLTPPEVAEFVSGAAGRAEHRGALAGDLHALTEGNPFLLCELWRTLVETGTLDVDRGAVRLTRPLAEIATPHSVREVASQRLARLDPVTRDVLELAAVAGPEFELDVVRRAAAGGLDRLDVLEPALRNGMVEEVPSPRLAYRFSHELVRRALYDRLSVLRRSELHLAIGEAIASSGPGLGARALADLAYHFTAAAPVGGPERAVEYNLLAADAANSALAFEQAAERLRAALRIGIADERRRAEALLALGAAAYRGSQTSDSLEAFREAAAIGRTLADGELLARAATGYENTCWRPGLQDQGARELLEEASAALSPEDSSLRVGVLSGLARALDFLGSHDRARVVRRSAIAMARRCGDRSALARGLMGSYWGRGTSLQEILDMEDKALAIGVEIGDVEIRAEAMGWRIVTLIALGDIQAASSELAAFRQLAQETRQPFSLHVAEHYGSALALLGGRLAEADAAAERSRAFGRVLRGRDPSGGDPSGVYGIQMFALRREQGRLSELAPVVRILAGGEAGGAWGPGLVALLADLDMGEEARRELDRVRLAGLEPLRESLWMASLTFLADGCAAVGDREMAALLYPELAPLAGFNVMIGHGVACFGAADRYLGMLAATLGDTERALAHLAAATQLNRRMGAVTWLAHTVYQHARVLLGAGEEERAAGPLAEAALLAEQIGLPTLRARIAELGPAAPPALPDGLSPREAQILRLVARGLANRAIGAELTISGHTAANHVRSILRKTGCANRTEAAAYAYRHRLAERDARE